MRRVWPDQFVEENNLAQNIYAVRRVLGDGDAGAKYVETIPKRGYRFVAEVEVLESLPAHESVSSAPATPPPTLARPPAFAGGGRGVPFVPKTHYVVSTGDVNIAY